MSGQAAIVRSLQVWLFKHPAAPRACHLPDLRCNSPAVAFFHTPVRAPALTRSDKTKAPIYRLDKIPGDEDTVIIVFSAGPPYEDIAFRIVRKAWDYSHRRGFRSTFDRGVLQRESVGHVARRYMAAFAM